MIIILFVCLFTLIAAIFYAVYKWKIDYENFQKNQYIKHFQYGLELNYFDSSDVEKIQFYLDLLKSNKQTTYDLQSIEKIINKYSQWRNNPSIKNKWCEICERHYSKLNKLIMQCSNVDIDAYYEKLKFYWQYYDKNRVNITSIFETFRQNLIEYIDWETHYNNIKDCINKKTDENLIVNQMFHIQLQEIESINQQIIHDICNGIKIDWDGNGYQTKIFKFLMQIK